MTTHVRALLLCAMSCLAACRALDRGRYYALIDGGAADGTDGSSRDGPTGDVRPGDGNGGPACNGAPDAARDGACDPIRIPQRPAGLGDADGGTTSLAFVVRRISIGFESRAIWGTHGFDRDNFCTDPLRPGPSRACRPPDMLIPEVEDGDRGRDNAIAARMGTIFAASGFTEADSNTILQDGAGNLAARVTFYGGSNDGRVRVEWLPVIHGHPAGQPTMRPNWDGRDIWHPDATLAYDASDPTVARVRSDSAFVSCGTLVAAIPSRLPIRFNSRLFEMRLTMTGGTFVGPIAANGTALGPLEFSGWWPISDALGDISSLGLCPPPPIEREPTWNLVRRTLSSSADLLTTGDIAPDTPCDALSFGFASEWIPVQLGPDERSTPRTADPCSPDAGVRD